MMRESRTLFVWIVCVLLAGCATSGGSGFEYDKTETYYALRPTDTVQVTQIAAQALRETGFTILEADDSTGYLRAKIVKGSSPTEYSYFLIVRVNAYDQENAFDVYVRSVAGPNVTFTYGLPKEIDRFYDAFNRLVKER